ncbi:mavicyanin-like [Tasmannia lanceolata]|uniref:mavicyanin-like n=1 Tax=Tasmannia lanceolata TaxID=3420 RepID=UPI0040641F1D
MSDSGLPLRSSLIILFLIFTTAGATDHIVGDNHGWNPGLNYTLWANNHTFYVLDLISFRYQRNTYNVYQVNETDYLNCTTFGAVGNWSSGKDFIELNKAKRYYFICPNFCYGGMKVSVLVHPLPSPPAASKSQNQKSGAETLFRQGSELEERLLTVCIVLELGKPFIPMQILRFLN